ncbi:putative bifunctional diguanylate cyclase/phosphodiesterase [Arvimicrobium flavum]|uniref:putative bifunctional diguanylate cyclase/phosphodiesterase n=1 Tax=Arvimicrobium flavum TaxID=3393320 RepID=UPI00237B0B16|nr:EAL domain-containing protein [Mesorhizobium shangrilense]
MAQNAADLQGSARLIIVIKSAYWIGLLIIAAMAMTSFVLLRQLMSQQEIDASVSQMNGSQMALSQRIIVLANAIETSPRNLRPQLLDELHKTTAEFARNHETLAERVRSHASMSAEKGDRLAAEVLDSRPYMLEQFTQRLVADTQRFITAHENSPYSVIARDGALDLAAANATLGGYKELGRRVDMRSNERLAEMLSLHKALYYGTVGVIVFVALFIFRPMSNAILRRTYELVDARNSMAFIAIHDGLTGLYNRAFLKDHFDTLIKGAQRRRERLAVIQFDLDRFKQINDTLGHAAGDYVLVATAQRMLGSCRASDVCVRLGGDEFVMILNAAGTTEDINALANRILSRINEPINYQSVTIMPGASAGIAVYPVDADNGTDLLVHADLALYAAKKMGGGAASFFSEELRRELDHRKKMEADLKAAIASEAFEPYFQPQISLSSNRITGVEALVRWRHAERGMIPPADFLPVAEKTGLMCDIGRILMRKAIRKAAEWHRAGIDFGRLAINVSGTELRENDFDTFLFDTLQKEGLHPSKLSLEIVESVILDDEKTGIAAKLRHMRSAGVYLELDDFGTGYASLSHVNPNEIDRLKIDRRFVQNINANGDNTKIVRAITELARGLGISIIAEGAETEAELELLESIGCDQVQGYSIAFPMPGQEAQEWLQQYGRKKPVLTVVA